MKFSEQWLREWVSPQLGTQALADQITMAGLEVDAVEPVAATFAGVVVAEVLEKTQHPDADKLSVCRVDDGSGEPVQVVCGAPNVAAGQKIAFARVGAVLPGDFKIRKAKLRGQESRGMICSASELGLEEETSPGILELPSTAPTGEDFRAWLGLDDHTIEVDLTPNRGDCLSLKGLAREVGVLNRLAVQGPASAPVAASHEATFPVRVEDAERCPRYIGRLITGVDVTAESPLWMVERLRRGGVRSIDPVVDVTNYVMLELGQPLHAFDRANLQGAVIVRLAREGERLVLLDGQEVSLDASTLVIADERGPLAIAGVMGGEHSGVSEQTRDIFLESAFFTPWRWPARRAPMACTPTPPTASSAAWTRGWPARPPSAPRHCCWRSSAARPAPWWRWPAMTSCPWHAAWCCAVRGSSRRWARRSPARRSARSSSAWACRSRPPNRAGESRSPAGGSISPSRRT